MEMKENHMDYFKFEALLLLLLTLFWNGPNKVPGNICNVTMLIFRTHLERTHKIVQVGHG